MSVLISLCWIAVFLIGASFVVRELVSTVGRGFPNKRRLMIAGAGLLFLISVTGYAAVTMIYGRTLGSVISDDGHRQADIMKFGARTYSIKVHEHSKRHSFSLRGRPQEVFWMRDNSAMGVYYGAESPGHVIEVNLILKAMSGGGLTSEEFANLNSNGAPKSSAEIAEFNLARQQARTSGLMWTDE